VPLSEHDARAALVDYGKRLWERRLVSGTSGNLSVKLDDGDLLVTPSASSVGTLKPADLVRVDGSGHPRDPGQRPTSELPLHLAAYRVRREIDCVMHTHPTFCVVWSRRGLFPQDTVGARETLGPVLWTPFFPNGSQELADVCAQALESGVDTILMERHGLTTVARTLEVAFDLTDLAEEAARVGYFGVAWGDFTGT
jgi:L-fuculose-phosphate aldolase